jgi:WD40 repeat protein
MRPSPGARAFSTAGLLCLGYLQNANGAPIPQTEKQTPKPQVMLAPAQVSAGQPPPKEPLPADARKPDRILRAGHKGSVQALAFSPDRKWLASGGDDKTIIVWNLSSGHEEFRLAGHRDTITSLLFKPDGTRLASADVSGVVRMWNVETRKMLFAIKTQRFGQAMAFSADGKTLIAGTGKRAKDVFEAAIGFYDAETGKTLRVVPTKWNFLTAIVSKSDGRLVVSGTVGADDDDDPNGSVQIFDAGTGEMQRTYPVIASAISTDGNWMASFDNSPSGYHAVLWNLADGRRAHELAPRNASRVIFRPDGQEIASAHGDSNAIDFVSTATGDVSKSLPGGGYGLGTIAYSTDGKLLAAGSYSYGTIKVWDLISMKEQATLYGQSPVQSVAFSPDGKLLATTSGELRVWDLSSLGEIVTLTDAPVNRAIFSADGKWLAANPGGPFPGKTLKIWNTKTWKEAGSFSQENGFPVSWLAFSKATSAPEKIGAAHSWEFISEGESQVVWGSSSRMALSPDGKWLAQPLEPTGTVEIWDATSGQKQRSITAHKNYVTMLSFSQDGRWLLTVGQESNPVMVQGQPGVMYSPFTVAVWNAVTWNKEFAFTFISNGGPGADISADGKFLAVTKSGGATKLFDLEQKKPVAVFASPDSWPGNLSFSPDGSILVQGAPEGIRLWKLTFLKTASN